MSDYVHRTLTYYNSDEMEQISDISVLEISEPVIILGEPGLGKTRLLRWLAEHAGWEFRSVQAFVNHPDPQRIIPTGTRIVIDGLDELSAAQESDPVYRVLGQLIKAGCPPFVLSCRAADWRGASIRRDVSEEYGVTPREMNLDPFSRDNALEFLATSLGTARASEVVAYLEKKGIPDLYGNPLTLQLFAEVAASDRVLPRTRAELLLRAAEVMWNERSAHHDKSALSNLDQDTALAAAGAASAAFILSGAEAISLDPSATDAPNILKVADLQALPGSTHIRSLIGSRLFSAVPGAHGRYKPIHRSVAEFLGARWLAGLAKDEQVRSRVLAMMTIDSGVPASLRGLHAWLVQDVHFANRVIATDPYGVLRYGDGDGLDIKRGRLLLRSLQALQQSNPYFRAKDWEQHSARGLSHPELCEDMRTILLSSETGFHLRTLLLGVIQGSELAKALAEDLKNIMLNENGYGFGYAEREDAAQTLVSVERESIDWTDIVNRLIKGDGEDATRLALNLMGDVGFEMFTPELIARTILTHLGLLGEIETGERESRVVLKLFGFSRRIPIELIGPVLDNLATLLPFPNRDIVDKPHYELNRIVDALVARYVATEDVEPLRLLKWIEIIQGRYRYSRNELKQVSEFLKKSEPIRQAIQYHLIFIEQNENRVFERIWRLADINDALALKAEDIIYFLRRMAIEAIRTYEYIEIWRELAAFANRFDSLSEDILNAARLYAVGEPALEEYLDELRRPRQKPKWEIENERRRAREEKKKAVAQAKARRSFAESESELRAGEFKWIYPTALAYLGEYRDIDSDLLPPDRIEHWLGSELRDASLAGFEAVLGRPDLPSASQVAEYYADSKIWNFIYPMIAGVLQRLREGRGLTGISADVLIAVRIGIHQCAVDNDNQFDTLVPQVDAELRRSSDIHEKYFRLLIEPSMAKKKQHISGLYELAREEADRELAARLAVEWLQRFPDLPIDVELELMDVLAKSCKFQVLREEGQKRGARGFVNDEQRLNWWAMWWFLGDFDDEQVVSEEDRNLIWHLRHRLNRGIGKQYPSPNVGAPALAWVVREFRRLWPKVERTSGVMFGESNARDAVEFLQSLINQLGSDTSDEAVASLEALKAEPEDGYTPALLYAISQQRSTKREVNFPGVSLNRLRDVVQSRPPASTDDLSAVICDTLRRLQSELRGNDTDTVVKYWCDDGTPRGEDFCTDRLVEDIMRLLPPFGISRTPQADMPNNKRADILFSIGDASLPIECKGQWNSTLWTAAGDQLDAFYLRDWRSQDRGVYLVYWFGAEVANKFRLKGPPQGVSQPKTPEELRKLLTACLPPARRGSIAIEVLDFTRS